MSSRFDLVEKIAKAIALADERNGAPPYEHRLTMGKHVREHLFDEAEAALEAVERALGLELGP